MQKNIDTPAHINVLILTRLALIHERVKTSTLEVEVETIKFEIKTNGVQLDKNLSDDVGKIMSTNASKLAPFMQKVLKQQPDLFSSVVTSL